MSLQKIKTNVKSGITDLKSAEGMKRLLVHIGVGAAIGVLVDLALQAVMVAGGVGEMLSKAGYPCLVGFKIYPQDTQYMAWNATTKAYEMKTGDWIAWDDLALLVTTVLLLLSKKIWFVLGFFLGWYFSGYFDLYNSLGLPNNLNFLKQPVA